MEISEELIGRFFAGQCNPEEVSAVLLYLNLHEAASAKYLGEEEWNQVSATDSHLSKLTSARMLQNIRSSTYQKASPKFSFKPFAIAASLFLLAAAFLFLLNDKNGHLQKLDDPKQEVWTFITNTGDKVIKFVLEDGTAIELAGHSEVSFPKHFGRKSRPVKLAGRALFKVAKDKKRPFVVFAGKTSTTALGTEFIIDSKKDQAITDIMLLEGKVLVKVVAGVANAAERRFLIPQQELIYSKATGMIIVQPLRTSGSATSTSHKRSFHAITSGVDISFTRQPVKSVLLALQNAYDTNIDISGVELADHYFTGSFHKDDSLDRILRVISVTNNLRVKKLASGYQIKNSQILNIK